MKGESYEKKFCLLLLFSSTLAACAAQTSKGHIQSFAITHVNLIPMTEEIILEDQTILADLISVGGNPLEDGANIQDIQEVMAAGHWYTRQILDQMMSLE